MEPQLSLIKTYSRFWRKNRSGNEAAELALALRALRKVAGHLGRNIKPVFWQGMAQDCGSAILLDPAPLRGGYPVPHRRFDLLVGQVVRQGLLSARWTEWVREKALREAATVYPMRDQPFFEAVIAAGEDIFLMALPKAPVWDLYLGALFRVELARPVRDPALPPSPESLAWVWLGKALLGQRRQNLHFYYDDAVDTLNSFVAPIRDLAVRGGGSTDRDERVALYKGLFNGLWAKSLSQWEVFEPLDEPETVNLFDEAAPKGELPEPDDCADEAENKEEEREASTTGGLEPQLAEEVNRLLEEDAKDMTQCVAVAVADPEAGAMETRFVPGRAISTIRPDPVQVERLRAVFKKQESLARLARRRNFRRGLSEGKLDARRLFRAPIDGKIFKNRQSPGNRFFHQICIVADASASMSGKGPVKPWAVAEKTFVSLAHAAQGFENLLDIYAYHEHERRCTLTRLNHGPRLYTVAPAGRTPSGQAILAAAMNLPALSSNRMIIHITDGAANCGLRLGDALNWCSKNKVDVYTIGCGCNTQTRDFLRAYFPPDRIYFMQDISQLALGLERLFSKTMLRVVG
ncbi:MAG: vWA domain-containing protein [Desulfatibacillaceae bacterium]|nr:vWA domain-containing protein [Desulfatibacillaceae bacterium]